MQKFFPLFYALGLSLQNTVKECLLSRPRVESSDFVMGYVLSIYRTLQDEENTMTLIEYQSSNNSLELKDIVLQTIGKDFEQRYIGIRFKVLDSVNYEIKKYIQSEDIEDVKKLLGLKEMIQVLVCPSQLAQLSQKFNNFLYQQSSRFSRNQAKQEYKYRAY